MPVTAELFEKWKVVKGLTSDRKACMALGLSNGNPGHWRNGKDAHAAVIERMARDLGKTDQEIAVLLFESMAEATNADASSRRTFQRLAKKVQALALMAVAVLVSSSFPAPAVAHDSGYQATKEGLYIMRTVAVLLKRLQQLLHEAFGIPGNPSNGMTDGKTALLRETWHHGLPA